MIDCDKESLFFNTLLFNGCFFKLLQRLSRQYLQGKIFTKLL